MKSRIFRSIGAIATLILIGAIVPSPASAQTTVSLAPWFHIQFVDGTGKPLSGGFLFTYSSGTTTPQATFADSLATIQNANPIPLDATGAPSNASGAQVPIFLTANAYKMCLYSSAMVLQSCQDPVSGWLGLTNLPLTWSGVQTFAQPTKFTQSDNQLIFNSASGAPVTLDIPPSNTGGPITIRFPNTAGTLSASGNTGTVTSVAMTVPSQFAIAGSPITSSGTLGLTMPGATGSGNVVLAASPTIATPTLTTPTATNPTINAGVSNAGTGFQHLRFTSCTPNLGGNTLCNSSASWNAAFADTSYTIVCSPAGSTAGNFSPVFSWYTKTAGGFSYSFYADTVSTPREINCIGVHD